MCTAAARVLYLRAAGCGPSAAGGSRRVKRPAAAESSSINAGLPSAATVNWALSGRAASRLSAAAANL